MNGQRHPRVKDYAKYKTLGSNKFFKSKIINIAHIVSEKYPN